MASAAKKPCLSSLGVGPESSYTAAVELGEPFYPVSNWKENKYVQLEKACLERSAETAGIRSIYRYSCVKEFDAK
jgi:hypothetical protein